MQFYKKRDLGTFISDTFNFFKFYGKNYFKNYILINGLLLILIVVIGILGFKDIFGQILNQNPTEQSVFFQQYFDDNLGVFIAMIIIMFFLYTFLMLVNYLFPVFYLKRTAEGNLDIKTDEILGDFRKNSGKILKLYLGMTFLVIPATIVLMIISYLLCIVPILFTAPALFNVTMFLSYDYFNGKQGFFESLSYGARAQFSYSNGREKSPFWKYWGSTIIIGMIYNIITMIFTYIPFIFVYARLLTSPSNAEFEQNPFTGTFGIIIFVISGISVLVSVILMNLMYVNCGLMYYDSRTDFHRKIELEEIETIGINE